MTNPLPFGLLCAIAFGLLMLIWWTQIETHGYVRMLEDALDAQQAYSQSLCDLNHILRDELEAERDYNSETRQDAEGDEDCR